jgi:type VI secretion system protein ImpK
MSNESLNDQMYWVCADALNLAAQLNTAVDLPTPDVFRQRIDHLFDNMRRSKPPTIALQDVNDAVYALAAFIDEQVLRSPWQGRQQWMARPLQLIYFGESTAGEGFFQRMQALQADTSRSHVLEIYYLCLALGFQGQYAMADKELSAIQADVGQTVARRPSAWPCRRGAFTISGHRHQPRRVGFGDRLVHCLEDRFVDGGVGRRRQHLQTDERARR